MLETLLTSLNNFFEKEILYGEFTITGGVLQDIALLDGQCFRIQGSVLNNALYQNNSGLIDEVFEGRVSLLAIPKAVMQLSTEIEEWQLANNGNSPYISESFGGYSYSKSSEKDTWQKAFSSRLKAYKKVVY